MKIAALALASALAAGSAQPALAQNIGQNDQNQYNQHQYNDEDQYNDQDQYGQNQNEDMNDETTGTTGRNMQGDNDSGNNRYGQSQNRDDNDRSDNRMSGNEPNWRHGHGWRHHHRWGMGGGMGPMMGHHRMMMGMMGPRGARFSFRNGEARMNVRCPPNEPVQTCVKAATELLDKIATLRNQIGPNQPGQSGTNGRGLSGSSNLNKNDESDSGTSSVTIPGTGPGAGTPGATQPPKANDSSDKQ